MTTEDEYLRSVERMTRGTAPAHREAVLDDLRGHFADAAEAGRPIDEVIAGLGAPAEIAEQAREQFGADDATADRAWWVLQGTAAVLALVTAVAVALLLPSYSTSAGPRTLVQVNGPWVALIALVPALVAVVPMVVPRRARLGTTIASAVILLVMVVIGGFSIGFFFLPSAMLSWAALIVWTRLRGGGFGIVWRIAGALLVLAPFGVAVPVLVAQAAAYPDTPLGSVWAWPVVAAIVLLAVLIAIGIPSAGWLLAVIGAVLLASDIVIAGGPLGLIALAGGEWLTIGLAHAVATRRR
ncbi:MAG: DUF1700 domain-containing protein [Microbacterium sp.]